LEWEQRVFKCKVIHSAVEGGRLGLQVEEDILKGDLIAFAWGRTRVSEAGVPEDLFNPAYSGCFDRIVRLHRCYHTLRLYACRLKKCASYFIYGLCVYFPFQSHTASCNQGTCRGKIFIDPAAYTISVLGWE